MKKELPKVYEPQEVEGRIYAAWEQDSGTKAPALDPLTRDTPDLTSVQVQGSGTTFPALAGGLSPAVPSLRRPRRVRRRGLRQAE